MPERRSGPDCLEPATTVRADSPTIVPVTHPQLRPLGGRMWAVQWRREDGAVRQKFYRRGAAAEVFARKLRDDGYDPVLFVARVSWQAAS